MVKSYGVDHWIEKLEKLDPNAVELLKSFLNRPENLLLSKWAKKNYAVSLFNLLKHTGKRINELTENDIENYIKNRLESGVAPSTLNIELILLKKLLRYAGVEIDLKLRLPRKEKFVVDPSQFLTEDEFNRLLSALHYTRDKALVMLLRETGVRIGEALALNVGDVEIGERYGRLHIRYSKTRERYVEFVRSIPFLKAWLSVHPDPKPDSPLFVSLRGELKRLTYDAFRHSLRRALRKAGLEKRVHPHLFRHQVATELLSSERLPEEVVRVYMGWKHGSQMVSRYSHVTSEKANELVMRARYGIETREEVEEPKGYRECPRCSRMVELKYKYCPHCGLALERKVAVEEARVREKVGKLMRKLIEDPELREKLRSILQEL